MFFKKAIFGYIIVFTLSFVPNDCFAQFLKHYGFKSGISNSWQTYNAWEVGELKYSGNRIGLSYGLYAEWLDNSFFSIKTELDYISKGMKAPDINGYAKEEERLDYLSLIILANIYTEINDVKIYTVVGPRVDISINKSLKVNGPTYIYNIMKKEFDSYKDILFGATLGLGCEIKNLLPFIIGLETRYSPNFSKIYNVSSLNTKNNSVEILLTVGF